MKKLLFTALFLILLATSVTAQVPVRWAVQDIYTNTGFADADAFTYSSSGSRAVNVSGGGFAVSRSFIAGDGSFSFRFISPGADGLNIGLDTSSTVVAFNQMDYTASWNGNLSGPSGFAADLSPLNESSVITFERTGTSLAVKKGATTIHTFTGVTTSALYLHVWTDSTTTGGVQDANVTGGSTGVPTPPASAPTVTVTPGYKRNHVTVTFPSTANGVNIYRSTTPGAQDFGVPIVTEWRLPTYEDKGLANGVTYYYKAKAAIYGLSESSASTEDDGTPAATGVLPTITDAEDLILGSPAVKPVGAAGTSYWFDRASEEQVIRYALAMPKKPLTASISGTVAPTNGSVTVTGSSTTFLTDYRNDGFIRLTDSGGTHRYYRIYFVHSNTSLELATAYGGATESGRLHRPYWDDAATDDDYFQGFLYYYDGGLNDAHLYKRTGNPYVLQLFREGTDSWYSYLSSLAVGDSIYENFNSPRQAAFAGLALRAIDGQTAYWNLIEDSTRDMYAVWIQNRITVGYFDNVRDASYVLQQCAFLGKAHPDSGVRTEFTTKALDGVLDLFEWQMDKYTDHQPRYDYADHAIDRHYNYHQPFIDAIMGEMYVMVHKLTGNATVRAGFLAWIDGHMNAWTEDVTSNPSVTTRRFFYELSNRSEVIASNPDPDPPDYDPPYDTIPANLTGHDTATLPEGRFVNNITVSNFGYAYWLTGNTVYRDFADEVVDASYGNSSGVFSDGYSALSEVRKNGKNTNESFRRGPNFYAYRDVIAPLSSGTTTALPVTGGMKVTGGIVVTCASPPCN